MRITATYTSFALFLLLALAFLRSRASSRFQRRLFLLRSDGTICACPPPPPLMLLQVLLLFLCLIHVSEHDDEEPRILRPRRRRNGRVDVLLNTPPPSSCSAVAGGTIRDLIKRRLSISAASWTWVGACAMSRMDWLVTMSVCS